MIDCDTALHRQCTADVSDACYGATGRATLTASKSTSGLPLTAGGSMRLPGPKLGRDSSNESSSSLTVPSPPLIMNSTTNGNYCGILLGYFDVLVCNFSEIFTVRLPLEIELFEPVVISQGKLIIILLFCIFRWFTEEYGLLL